MTQKKPSEMDEMWQKAKAYNARLGIQPVPDAFSFRDGIHDKNYESLLQIENNDIMEYVEVPYQLVATGLTRLFLLIEAFHRQKCLLI